MLVSSSSVKMKILKDGNVELYGLFVVRKWRLLLQSNLTDAEAVIRRCSVKKVFLEISQNSQENTCAKVSFLIKLHASPHSPATLSKKRLLQRCFPVNFVKFPRTSFTIEHLWWLLLQINLAEAHSRFKAHLFSFCSCDNCQLPKKG